MINSVEGLRAAAELGAADKDLLLWAAEEIEKLADSAMALERDARRYRWLRNNSIDRIVDDSIREDFKGVL